MRQSGRSVGRNQRMDLYRGAAIYFVIAIHVPFPGGVGGVLRALARFAVPFFFLTAGYFSLHAQAHTLLRRAGKTLGQLALACVPYLLLGCWLALGRGEGAWKWLSGLMIWDTLKEFLLYHTVPFPYAWQLWFLGALFTVYLFWWAVTLLFHSSGRPVPYGAMAAAGGVLLCLHLALGEGAALLGRAGDARLLRNAFLDGYPFFALGAWMAVRRRQVRQLPVPWHWMAAAGVLLTLAEARLAGAQELYVGTVVLAAGLMGRAIRYRRAPGGRLCRAVQFCGRELTLLIFALHMLVLALVREVPALEWLEGLPWLLPPVVAALSTLAALGLWKLRRYFGSGRKALP